MKQGTVFITGSGPGDPGLITVKALECLKKADVIIYDRLIPKTILKHHKPGAVLEYVGKAKGDSVDQEKINRLLLSHALKGKTVVRLKGGDPFIFGRGTEEMMFLKDNGIECEVIPGVSSFYAVPESCGIPLTHRGLASGFLVVTGHEDPLKKGEGVDWRHIAKFQGTIVIMMGLSNLKEITKKLLQNGKSGDTLAAVIANGTTKKEARIVGTLSDIADKAARLKSPAICVIGDVVKVGFSLNAEFKPLANKRYLSTASDTLNKMISGNLKRLGASVDCLPMIKITPDKDTSVLDRIIDDVRSFDWLVFTSRHGVYYFMKRYCASGGRIADLAGRVACVGRGTASELEKHGIEADLVPEKFTTKDLGIALVKAGLAGKKIALLRTKMKRDPLKKALRDAGALITDCVVYNVEESREKESLAKAVAKKPDGIFFLSPKSASVFFDMIPHKMKDELRSKKPFYSIGPVTTRELKRHGVAMVRSADEHTVDGLTRLCLDDSSASDVTQRKIRHCEEAVI